MYSGIPEPYLFDLWVPNPPLGYFLRRPWPSYEDVDFRDSMPPTLTAPGPLTYNEYFPIPISFFQDIQQENFFANFTVHEFEALLFSDSEKFELKLGNEQVRELKNIRNEFASPEYINGGDHTAPSKRIFKLYPRYKKVADGAIIAKAIGINTIREQCPHFKAWVDRMIVLGGKVSDATQAVSYSLID